MVGCFIEQDYDGEHMLLIFNNSEVSQQLDAQLKLPTNKIIKLINQCKDSETKEDYTNLGAIYRDALSQVPDNIDIITHFDDDDIFLPNHISEGVRGFKDAKSINLAAYKPNQSWFRHASGVDKMGNNLEPSIFIDAKYVKDHGYKQTTTDQHFGWFGPLLENNELFIDPHGASTLIYNWGDVNIPTFKTSGNSGNPDNFLNYRIFSQDHGDHIINPISRESLNVYYDQVGVEDAFNELRDAKR